MTPQIPFPNPGRAPNTVRQVRIAKAIAKVLPYNPNDFTRITAIQAGNITAQAPETALQLNARLTESDFNLVPDHTLKKQLIGHGRGPTTAITPVTSFCGLVPTDATTLTWVVSSVDIGPNVYGTLVNGVGTFYSKFINPPNNTQLANIFYHCTICNPTNDRVYYVFDIPWNATGNAIQSIGVPAGITFWVEVDGFQQDRFDGSVFTGPTPGVVTFSIAPQHISRVRLGFFMGAWPTGTANYVDAYSDPTFTLSLTSREHTRIISVSADLDINGKLDFGTVPVGSSVQKTITAYNYGNRDLTMGWNTPTGFTISWPLIYTTGVIPPLSSKEVIITWTPTGPFLYNDVLAAYGDFNYVWGASAVKVTGQGIPATRIISLGTFPDYGNTTFGTVITGNSATAVIDIINSGNSPLTVTSISIPVSGFSINWLSGAIPAYSSQSVTVTFAPLSVLTYDGTFTVNSNADSGTNTANLYATGGESSPPAPPTPILSGRTFLITNWSTSVSAQIYPDPASPASVALPWTGVFNKYITNGSSFILYMTGASLSGFTVAADETAGWPVSAVWFSDCYSSIAGAVFAGPDPDWFLSIAHSNCTSTPLWLGAGPTNTWSPTGTYTYVFGLNPGPSTIDIEEVP